MLDSPQTILSALAHTASAHPERGITVFDRRGQNGEFHTYAQLLAKAHALAPRLAAAGVGPGDRLLICLPTSWELLEVFFATLVRGALPTLVAPPGALGGASAHARKVAGLIELMGSKRFYCDASARRELAEFGESDIAAAALTADELGALAPAAGLLFPECSPDSIAFLQLTSGSTGRQRAVMIRHSNVIANTRAIGKTLRLHSSGDPTVVCWLPMNHDMGLVGCLLFALVSGFNLSLLRPETFLARPHLWLREIARHPISLSPGPNFAYQLAIERVADTDLAGCDLSRWSSASTGAEMIRAETCAAFSAKLGPFGFTPASFQPCYGMAEATLEVTCDVRFAGPRTAVDPENPNGRQVVCCGAPVEHTQVRISPPGSSSALPAGSIGEVCASGPGIFAGYYQDAEATGEALVDGWLRTGDLGFMKDGELYITGRIKELLIIHGHNFMPHEIEWLAESATGGGGAARCGAFSIDRGAAGEQAVVVAEVLDAPPESAAQLQHDIRSRIGRALGLPLYDVVLVRRGQLPKTTSGKIQRSELRRRYLEGTLERLL